MAETNSPQMANVLADPPVDNPVSEVGGRLRAYVARITLASQANGDTIYLTRLPKGAVPQFGLINNSVSLGTATLSIGTRRTDGGDSLAAATLRAAATKTSGTPEIFGVAATSGVRIGTALNYETDVVATIGTANLPASGELIITIFATVD